MKRFPLVLTVLAACSAPTDDPGGSTTATHRPAMTPLLGTSATSLAGQDLIATSDGTWQVRRVAATETNPSSLPRPSESLARGGEADSRTTADPAPTGSPADSGAPVAESARLGTRPEAEAGGSPGAALEFERRFADETRPAADDAAASPLRAGTIDDNADHAAFCDWLDGLAEAGQLAGRYAPMAVRDRRSIRVLDTAGAPIPGAEVTVVDEAGDRVAWRGKTYGDGRVPFFPGLAIAAGAEPPATWLLEVRSGDRFLRQHWDPDGEECTVRLAGDSKAAEELALDVVFLIDTTGSMSDEIERIKQTLMGVTTKLSGLDREFSLRYGAVLYRDITDDYVTAAHPFTSDLPAFAKALQEIEAQGGGDSPESLNQGLAVAVDDMEWRDDAARLVFLIADAPPHLDYENDVPYPTSCQRAVSKGIKIHAIAASGLDQAGSAVFRQVAHLTRGKFVFIEYGGDITSSGESHGVPGVKQSNNLDDILFEQIRDEIAGWGRS